jgi:UDP-N-acetylglucosamine 2-epimerase (non-hydrolysing)
MRRLMFVVGTRPEAIKLGPVVERALCLFDVRVCVTAQHREMLDQVMRVFGMVAHHDLNVMQAGQTLAETAGRILTRLNHVIAADKPDMVVVQGDTTTTFAGALAAFYAGVPVAHVEAGLRTGDRLQPFPEEMNRVLTTRLADLHFAPTERSKANLLAEGTRPDSIYVTGNSGIDAVLRTCQALDAGTAPAPDWPFLDPSRRLLLVTVHRRESFGEGILSICSALVDLAQRDDVQIVIPVHPNPCVRDVVKRLLRDIGNIHLLEPLDYVEFVDLMRRSHILITDSGGIQEEGPSLGKPILVLRDKTERPEAVEAGTVVLTGCCRQRILTEASRLLDDPEHYALMSTAHNPYGDGHAAERIVAVLDRWQSRRDILYGGKTRIDG